MKTNYELVREAIANKSHIIAEYKGYVREMCPHMIGTKDGRAHAFFYQFGGESSSGIIIEDSPNNWRCIPVDGLENVRIQEGEWYSGTNHSRKQTCIEVIDLEVEY